MIKIIVFNYKLENYIFLFSNIYVSFDKSLLRDKILSDGTDNPDDINSWVSFLLWQIAKFGEILDIKSNENQEHGSLGDIGIYKYML